MAEPLVVFLCGVPMLSSYWHYKVSVLAGSYPAVTVLLAVAVLRQRAHPVQTFGAAGTIAGILLLAAGSG